MDHPLSGTKFTARDRDNDARSNGGNTTNNCAVHLPPGNAGGF